MRHLVSINFPPPKGRSSKLLGPASSVKREDSGQSVPRSRSDSTRSRSMITDTLDLDKLPWHVYERGSVERCAYHEMTAWAQSGRDGSANMSGNLP